MELDGNGLVQKSFLSVNSRPTMHGACVEVVRAKLSAMMIELSSTQQLLGGFTCIASGAPMWQGSFQYGQRSRSNVSCGDGPYFVPSGKEDGTVYDVTSTIGLCTCRSGEQGAFGKHQARVHKLFGGKAQCTSADQGRSARAR
ncbi:hypothetical protein HPB48_026594 [Haemaphysalis longicornis]|uniref:Uncharacterized protein n=1 Tax=Haemaphysalis longicornis TaxID=44386 RepID=A0A9J6HC83_HAELO|nr:hypothetical protein HPB48_026594 [Haemaphysalis longicornis]